MGYRAPSYSITQKAEWALQILKEEGFRYDSSIFPIHHDRYGIPQPPRFPHQIGLAGGGGIIELPPSTVRLMRQNIPVAGGGYLRLLPYWFLRWAIRRINQAGQPAILYLHPWEREKIIREGMRALDGRRPRRRIPELWDGKSAWRIVAVIAETCGLVVSR